MTSLVPSPAENSTAARDFSHDTPAPTVDQIDAYITDYESAETVLRAAQEIRDAARGYMIALVQAHGSPVPNAEQSKRLVGRRNTATITTGTVVTVNEDAVMEMKKYCGDDPVGLHVFSRLFATETKHKLLDGARNVLAEVVTARRTHEKLQSLFGRCFDIKPKSPSLKTVTIQPEKPARKPRARKAA